METPSQDRRDAAQAFIEAARASGTADETVVRMLKNHGWSEGQIGDLFAAICEAKTGLTVPGPSVTRGESAKDAFLHLLSFATLGTWSIAAVSMAFTLIERYLPDPTQPYYQYGSSAYAVSTQMASIIVAFPIYVWVMWLIGREIRKNPERGDSGVRKWLTYLALFVTAGIMIGDIITLLTYFLQGELSLRFVLKVVAVMAFAGGIFWYYLGATKRKTA